MSNSEPQQYGMDGRRLVRLPKFVDEDGIPTCPECGCQHFRVRDSEPWGPDGKVRYRTCDHCGFVIRTIEFVNE
jgi:hypothetical protein